MTLYELVKQLDFEKVAGSEGEKKARNIFKEYLREYGLKGVEHPFSMNCFTPGKAVITYKRKTIKALPFGLVKSGNEKGELVFLENSEELFYQRGMYKNKIILTNSRSAKLTERLKEEEIQAIIYVSPPYREIMSLNLRQTAYENGAVPAFSISYQDAKELAKYSKEIINIKTEQSTKKKKATNLIVDIPGTGIDKTLTIICAHYDSVATSHGSNDNSAGSAILLKIAEHFSLHRPLRDLRIIFFSGEEMGLLGSFAYARDFKEELKNRMGLLINVDLSGDDIGFNSFVTLGTNEMIGYIDGVLKENGLVFKSSLDIFSSDCMPFSVYEIPSVNIYRAGGDSGFHVHTCQDTADRITQRGLEPTFQASLILCERLLNAKVYPVKTSCIDSSLRDKIEEYIFNSTQSEPKLEWKKKYEK